MNTNTMQISRPKSISFSGFPEFKPNLTPRQIMALGSFGGTYWRPIFSTITKKKYKNEHKKYPASWWKNIPSNYLVSNEYVKSINKYNVIVGSSLKLWEEKKWITKHHPYGWVQWYCDFFKGKRSLDDKRQISRWRAIAGPNGRFRRRLINLINHNKTSYRDRRVSPKIRQVLQHWGYKLTKADYEKSAIPV